MRTNIRQDLEAVTRRVETLEAELEVERAARVKATNAFLYQLRSIRATVIRQELPDQGEKWHVGPVYTLGSRLDIPGRPRVLQARRIVEGCKKKDISTIRLLRALNETEGLIDDSSNGVPRTV